jgi:hypothetical protein
VGARGARLEDERPREWDACMDCMLTRHTQGPGGCRMPFSSSCVLGDRTVCLLDYFRSLYGVPEISVASFIQIGSVLPFFPLRMLMLVLLIRD